MGGSEMITFLPFPNHRDTAKCLDWKRLQNQIAEGMGLLEAMLTDQPPTAQWELWTIDGKLLINELIYYVNCMHDEWQRRPQCKTVHLWHWLRKKVDASDRQLIWPEEVHRSHRANLCLKDPDHYKWNLMWEPYQWLNPSFGSLPIDGSARSAESERPEQTKNN